MTSRLQSLCCWAALLAGGAVACRAQQLVAPTPETVGAPRGSDWDDYNIVDSFETGYRFATVTGNEEEYRSSVNFADGIRLLGGSLGLNSKDGHGFLFDDASITATGLGGDPYQAATFRIEKNRWYRYDLLWRQNNYFNPGLVTGGAAGAHLLDTTYGSQDHDLTILPGSNTQFFFGYSHDNQSGAGITTIPAFDTTTASFPVFSNVRIARNEYRVGTQLRFHGLTFNWTTGWEDFKDDSSYQVTSSTPTIPATGATLNSFLGTGPVHGTSPYWRVGVLYDRRIFNVNGRFTYTSGQHAYLLDQNAIGVVPTGPANEQVYSFGNAQRPVATGNLTLALLPTDRLTITNETSTYNVRTEGESTYAQVDDATSTASFFYFDYLGIFTLSNQTDFHYRVKPWLGFYGGYHYSDRRIRSVEQPYLATAAGQIVYDQTNRLNSGVFGVRLSALKALTITADAEIGRNSLPFAPKGDGNYHAIEGRIRYKLRKLDLTAWSHEDVNVNAVALTSYSSNARTYAGSASWTPVSWFSLDASYSKLHLNTLGGIAYFIGPEAVQGESIYISNIHSANLGARFAIKKLASLYLGYSIVQDTGDGRAGPVGDAVGSTLPAFQAAQTFPMRYQSPIARLSFRLAEKIRLNVGYQYYGYRENFYGAQDYQANTGYTSLLWSF